MASASEAIGMKTKQKLSERITLRLPYDLSQRLKMATPHKRTGDVVRLAIENFLNESAAETAAEEPAPPVDKVCRKPIWESKDALIASQFDARLRVVQSIHGGGDNTLAITWARLTDRLPLKGMAGMAETADGGLLVTRQLMARMPWLEQFAESLERELKLQLAIGKPWFWMPPTMLVGPPGVGKSHAARLIGQLSGCAVATLDVGGTSDNRALEGTARGWSSTQPCWPLVTIHNTRCANPVLVLDEIDKAAGSDANLQRINRSRFLPNYVSHRHLVRPLRWHPGAFQKEQISLGSRGEHSNEPGWKEARRLHREGGLHPCS